ncbi:MAG: IS3 family transposase [Candidatus Pristimantibacillus sp.]
MGPVKEMCHVLAVSESGYYRSLKPVQRQERRQLLLVKINEIIGEHEDNSNYGVQRMLLALSHKDIETSYSTVYRIMKQQGLVKKAKRHPNGITREDAAAQNSENLIQRDFTATAANKKWLSDITEVPCSDGKLDLSAVLDCYNGEIVGIAMDDNMRKELCIQAFENACKARNARGMIFHSDRGSQFTSQAFRESLAKRGAIQSMSGTGRCYDNARMESFFATLKKEKLYQIRTERYPISYVKSLSSDISWCITTDSVYTLPIQGAGLQLSIVKDACQKQRNKQELIEYPVPPPPMLHIGIGILIYGCFQTALF